MGESAWRWILGRRRKAPRPVACGRLSRGEALEPRRPLAADQFAVIGDFGKAGPDEAAVAELVKSWDPAFIITVGDNNYERGEAETIDANIGQYYQQFIGNYQGAYGPGSPTDRFFPSPGNHDWSAPDLGPYLDYFTLPGNERYYDFVKGPVHFFAVDSDGHEPDGTSPSSIQGQWLQAGLAASTSRFQVVYFHHAAYSSGPHGSDTRMQWPFREWGADLVLTGHDHHYERILVDGLTYIVDGTGGKSLRPLETIVPGSQAADADHFGALRVTASDDRLALDYFIVDGGGTLVDQHVIFADAAGTPALGLANVSALEGDAAASALVIQVIAAPPPAAPASVVLSTIAGAAAANLDFVPLQTTLSFQPGQTRATVTLQILGDDLEEPTETFFVRLSRPQNATFARREARITIRDDDGAAPALLFSTTSSGNLLASDGASLAIDDSDIAELVIDGDSYRYAIRLDGSDVGLSTSDEDLDALAVLPDGSLLVSTVGSYSLSAEYALPASGSGATLAGAGEDLLRFVPRSLGDETTGSWSLYFDGSTQGLSGSAATLDAAALLPDGRLVLSTAGSVTVGGISAQDEDLLALEPIAGAWSLYFDGSDVGLTTSDEDLDGLFVDTTGPTLALLFSTRGPFDVGNLSGDDEDVLRFVPSELGSQTAGEYSETLALDGSQYGLAGFDLDGLALATAGQNSSQSSSPTQLIPIVGAEHVDSTPRRRRARRA